jgi:ABC-type multidrug transport system fused ATPase/permease subunit
MQSYFFKYFSVATQLSQGTKATEEQPIPVQNIPQPPGVQSITNWVVQGGITGLMIVVIIYMGVPIINLIKLFVSEDAKTKREREEKTSENLSDMFETLRQSQSEQLKSLKEGQAFLQEMMKSQQQHANAELSEVFNKLTNELSKIQSVNAQQQRALTAILTGAESIKVQIINLNQPIPVRVIKVEEK